MGMAELLKECNDDDIWELMKRDDVKKLVNLVGGMHTSCLEEFIKIRGS